MLSVGLFELNAQVQDVQIEVKWYFLYLSTGQLIGKPLHNFETVTDKVKRYLKRHLEVNEVKIFTMIENEKPKYERTIRRSGFRFSQQVKAIGATNGNG